MKSRNLIIVLLASVLVCVCVFQKNGIAQSGKDVAAAKIAVVNIEKLLVDSKKNELFETSFKADTEKVTAGLKKLDEEILDGRESLRHLKPTSDDYAKRGRELMEKEMALETRTKYMKQEFARRRQKWLEFSFRAILEEIDKVAKAEGYDMVMAKEGYHWPSASSNELMLVIQTTKVLYHADKMDITEKVLESWNAAKLD